MNTDPALHVDVSTALPSGFRLDARFTAQPGFTIVFGVSGSGKTTLLNSIAGLRRIDSGRLQLNGRTLFDSAAAIDLAPGERRIGYVFQGLALFPHMTLAENVGYGLFQLTPEQRDRRITEMLESFRIGHLAERRPSEVSGGERQRTALARSLVIDPDALLLDEPLAALDDETKEHIIADLRRWNRARPIPVLYVTHSRIEALALGEQALVLRAGRIVAHGPAVEVLTLPSVPART